MLTNGKLFAKVMLLGVCTCHQLSDWRAVRSSNFELTAKSDLNCEAIAMQKPSPDIFNRNASTIQEPIDKIIKNDATIKVDYDKFSVVIIYFLFYGQFFNFVKHYFAFFSIIPLLQTIQL
ncbi:hypothetical protein TSAR_007927 [Trichomalopsis sarcophagae]|uniref:Uncharacterized protein n=1 Tax=Trichomalopsis sarcophagae TaxID=543379 RepID=A0A232FC59_9HYME|nr:hypothetical protein TSAR_007927 [Trichomalopsis sarcophagae]